MGGGGSKPANKPANLSKSYGYGYGMQGPPMNFGGNFSMPTIQQVREVVQDDTNCLDEINNEWEDHDPDLGKTIFDACNKSACSEFRTECDNINSLYNREPFSLIEGMPEEDRDRMHTTGIFNTTKSMLQAEAEAKAAGISAYNTEQSKRKAEGEVLYIGDLVDVAKDGTSDIGYMVDGAGRDISYIQVMVKDTELTNAKTEDELTKAKEITDNMKKLEQKNAEYSEKNKQHSRSDMIASHGGRLASYGPDALKQIEKRETTVNQPFTNIKEGFVNHFTEQEARDILDQIYTDDEQAREIAKKRLKEYRDTEYLAQEDNIMNKILMDFMINNSPGSNVETVYNNLSQENNDKLRKLSIKNYYTKTYKEYIYLIKIVIYLILFMIPVLILNRLEFLDKTLTLLIVVVSIFLGVLYISYRLYLLYMKDNKDFDKNRIPFSREEAENLKETGIMYTKPSGLQKLGITCIGDECCDASMSYDATKNKCILQYNNQENFTNIFENLNNTLFNNNQSSIINQNNSHENNSNYTFLNDTFLNDRNFREGFVSDKNKAAINNKLLIDSLANSTDKSMINRQDLV